MVMLPDRQENLQETLRRQRAVSAPVTVRPVAQPLPSATTPPVVTPPQQAAPYQPGIPITSAIDPNFVKAVTTGTPYTPNMPGVATTAVQGRANELLESIQNRLSQPASLTGSPYYKAAMKAAEGQGLRAGNLAMEQLNTRGILNSSVTADRVAQIRQQALTDVLPAIMERTYGIQQDELRNMIGLANLYMQQVQTEQDRESKASQQKLDNAWSRVKNIGYVDNEASLVLGIPAGTISSEAKRYDEDRKLREKIAAQQNAVSWANVNKQPAKTEEQTYKDEAWAAYREGRATPEQIKAIGQGEKAPSASEENRDTLADAYESVDAALKQSPPEVVIAEIRKKWSEFVRSGVDPQKLITYIKDLSEK